MFHIRLLVMEVMWHHSAQLAAFLTADIASTAGAVFYVNYPVTWPGRALMSTCQQTANPNDGNLEVNTATVG
jgi:hypothetical protein